MPITKFNFRLTTFLLFLACTSMFVKAEYSPEEKLKSMGIELPKPATPVANYVNTVRVGNLVFLSGHGPVNEKGKLIKGKLGDDTSIEDGSKAARLTGIGLLASLKGQIKNLDKVVRIVKVTGMVNSTDNFTQHPEVVNGFSDFIVEVFGDKGKHARAAVGMSSLPRGMVVEIEMIVEVRD